jgi:hypothetical protein
MTTMLRGSLRVKPAGAPHRSLDVLQSGIVSS